MQPNPYGPPGGGAPPGPTGAGRFTKTAVIGGAIGGVLSVIPLLKILNCCFCMLNMGGAAIGLSMYLKEHPGENISNGDAAVSGAISGGIAGFIAGVIGFVISLATTAAMADITRQVPRNMRPLVGFLVAGGGAIGMIVGPLIYAGFGALGGFLSMQLFFKDRLRS